MKKIIKIVTLLGVSLGLTGLLQTGAEFQKKAGAFWDTVPGKSVSYIYAPGLTTTEVLMGRYCPEYTASTGEKVISRKGGHVIGQPHTGVAFPDVDMRKPSSFTLNPITAFMNGVRQDLFSLVERFFIEKIGITVIDNPKSSLSVINYTPKLSAASIAQTKDIKALHKHYTKHIKDYPETDIILYGDSRGAATIFNFIAQHKPAKVKAAVIEGIFDTVPHCIKHFLYEDKSPEAEDRLHQILSFTMGRYKKYGINPRKSAETINDDIPLLFVTSLKDGLVPPQGTIGLYKRLKERGHKQIHLLVLKKSLHPIYMIDDPEDQKVYETVVHAYYKHYGLAHNKTKAAAGQKLFLETQPSVDQLAKLYPLPKCELCY